MDRYSFINDILVKYDDFQEECEIQELAYSLRGSVNNVLKEEEDWLHRDAINMIPRAWADIEKVIEQTNNEPRADRIKGSISTAEVMARYQGLYDILVTGGYLNQCALLSKAESEISQFESHLDQYRLYINHQFADNKRADAQRFIDKLQERAPDVLSTPVFVEAIAAFQALKDAQDQGDALRWTTQRTELFCGKITSDIASYRELQARRVTDFAIECVISQGERDMESYGGRGTIYPAPGSSISLDLANDEERGTKQLADEWQKIVNNHSEYTRETKFALKLEAATKSAEGAAETLKAEIAKADSYASASLLKDFESAIRFAQEAEQRYEAEISEACQPLSDLIEEASEEVLPVISEGILLGDDKKDLAKNIAEFERYKAAGFIRERNPRVQGCDRDCGAPRFLPV
jgi:hypothetical protein